MIIKKKLFPRATLAHGTTDTRPANSVVTLSLPGLSQLLVRKPKTGTNSTLALHFPHCPTGPTTLSPSLPPLLPSLPPSSPSAPPSPFQFLRTSFPFSSSPPSQTLPSPALPLYPPVTRLPNASQIPRILPYRVRLCPCTNRVRLGA